MDQTRLEEMTLEECMDRLRSERVARISVIVNGFPLVLPVNYRLAEHGGGAWVAIRSRRGGIIDEAPQPVAVEIDGIDSEAHQGWSVLVRGSLLHVDPEAADFADRFDPAPWLSEDRDSWLIVEPFHISGRRLLHSDAEWAFSPDAYL
jgi:nitroimidazol reductase NimA-like FMN-containing flavoprotein (pyridoxamine 5'-phosphate oxidase superfamily)